MKIIIITDAWHPQINGVVRTYENLRRELEVLGHTVKIVGPRDFPLRIPLPGYKEIELALFPYRQLKKIIKDFAPDHIHLATEGSLGCAGRRYCLKYNEDFSTSYHTQFPEYIATRAAKLLQTLYKPAYNAAQKWVKSFHQPSSSMMVATRSLEDQLRKQGFTCPMHRLIRGVNLDLYYAPTEQDKNLLENLKRPIALYVGRIAIEKNIEDFLKMEWSGSKLLIGDGPSREYLAQKYPEAIFAGKKEKTDLAAHYRAADVFVFPSRTDTFGMVLIEALASGLPVAAYNVTGPKDIITKPELGNLTENNLAEAARKALETGTSEERSNYTRKKYRWDEVANQFENAIKQQPLQK